jgi:serine/threonine protein kinase
LAYSFPAELRGNYYLLYERADKGSLDTFWKNDDLKRLRLPFARRVQIALDIITAMRFLHGGNQQRNIKGCFHRDIKSANIVLKQDLTAQLIDCGLAKFVVDKAESSSTTGPKGTPGYICDRYQRGTIPFDEKCDVYSFDLFCWSFGLDSCKIARTLVLAAPLPLKTSIFPIGEVIVNAMSRPMPIPLLDIAIHPTFPTT